MKRRILIFKKQFLPVIESGRKFSTFRIYGKRNPRPCCVLDMRYWEGKPYRTKQVRFAEAVCVRVERFFMDSIWCVLRDMDTGNNLSLSQIENYAVSDGFNDSEDFFDFFIENYKEREINLIRISWDGITFLRKEKK